jgi:hypothetical protein
VRLLDFTHRHQRRACMEMDEHLDPEAVWEVDDVDGIERRWGAPGGRGAERNARVAVYAAAFETQDRSVLQDKLTGTAGAGHGGCHVRVT